MKAEGYKVLGTKSLAHLGSVFVNDVGDRVFVCARVAGITIDVDSDARVEQLDGDEVDILPSVGGNATKAPAPKQKRRHTTAQRFNFRSRTRF